MHKLYKPVLLAIGAATLSGCATSGPDARLAGDTAAVLGARPDEVVISGRRDVFPSTYYTASVAGRAYSCQVLTVGFVRTPVCTTGSGGMADPRPSGGHPRRG